MILEDLCSAIHAAVTDALELMDITDFERVEWNRTSEKYKQVIEHHAVELLDQFDRELDQVEEEPSITLPWFVQ